MTAASGSSRRLMRGKYRRLSVLARCQEIRVLELTRWDQLAH